MYISNLFAPGSRRAELRTGYEVFPLASVVISWLQTFDSPGLTSGSAPGPVDLTAASSDKALVLAGDASCGALHIAISSSHRIGTTSC